MITANGLNANGNVIYRRGTPLTYIFKFTYNNVHTYWVHVFQFSASDNCLYVDMIFAEPGVILSFSKDFMLKKHTPVRYITKTPYCIPNKCKYLAKHDPFSYTYKSILTFVVYWRGARFCKSYHNISIKKLPLLRLRFCPLCTRLPGFATRPLTWERFSESWVSVYVCVHYVVIFVFSRWCVLFRLFGLFVDLNFRFWSLGLVSCVKTSSFVFHLWWFFIYNLWNLRPFQQTHIINNYIIFFTKSFITYI